MVWLGGAITMFALLVVLSVVLVERQNRLVCEAITDNRTVIEQLLAARREPLDPGDYEGDLAAVLEEMQVRADAFAATATAVLNSPPECTH